MKFLNLLKKLQKGGNHAVMTIAGLGFVIFTILPYISDWTTDSPWWMSASFGVAGLVMIFFGVRGLKNVFTESLDDMNSFNKVDIKQATPEQIEQIRTSTSPVKEYYFHYCGKLNQSYILETPEREPIFEINCEKMGMVNDYVFTFKNCLTGEEETRNISHTITTSYGSDDFQLVDKSYFNIDGENIWQFIGNMGYSAEPYLDPVAWSFKLKHYGIEVGDIKCAGTNILPQYEGKGGLRDVAMSSGLYRVYCRQEDIEAAAILAFTAHRIEII